MSLLQWRKILTVITEGLGLIGLFFAPDAEQRAFLLVPVALLLVFAGVRASFWVLFSWIATVVLSGIVLGWQGILGVPLAATAGLVAVHSSLWLARPPLNLSFWRLGIAFLSLVVGGILAPEAYMFVLIFVFAITASIQLTFQYLEGRFAALGVDLGRRRVERSFFLSVIFISLAVFVLGLALFPILPRSRWSENFESTMPGYSDRVSFRYSTREWVQADARPLVWIRVPEVKLWDAVVPFGMLRGKALDHFDGVEWQAGTRSLADSNSGSSVPSHELLGEATISRVPFAVDVLLIPYSAFAVGGNARWNSAGEWSDGGREREAIEYKISLAKKLQIRRDKPLKVHSQFPLDKRFRDIGEEGRRLGDKMRAEGGDFRHFLNAFRGFAASEMPVASALNEKHPIPTFFFETKSGHCELFATTLALLLRAGGIPSRLVVGFRAPMPAAGDLLMKFRGRDAHVWVEAWDTAKGWIPLDPTPAMPASSAWWSPVEGLYDWISMFWGQKILGFEWDRRKMANNLLEVYRFLPFILLALLIGALYLKRKAIWRFLTRKTTNREKLAIWAQRREISIDPNGLEIFQKWLSRYERARFGRDDPTLAEIRAIMDEYHERRPERGRAGP